MSKIDEAQKKLFKMMDNSRNRKHLKNSRYEMEQRRIFEIMMRRT